MRILSQPQEDQLLGVVNPRSPFGYRDEAMIRFTLQTGLRVSELVGLTVFHVCCRQPQGPHRMVRHSLELGELAKGGRNRTVPLTAEARQAVAQILAFNKARGFSVAPEAPLFPNRKHQAMSARAAQRMLAGYRERAELDVKATPHTLRHTMASRMIDHDVPTHRVQIALGHRRLSSTQRYLHSSPEQLAAAMARISRV